MVGRAKPGEGVPASLPLTFKRLDAAIFFAPPQPTRVPEHGGAFPSQQLRRPPRSSGPAFGLKPVSVYMVSDGPRASERASERTSARRGSTLGLSACSAAAAAAEDSAFWALLRAVTLSASWRQQPRGIPGSGGGSSSGSGSGVPALREGPAEPA